MMKKSKTENKRLSFLGRVITLIFLVVFVFFIILSPTIIITKNNSLTLRPKIYDELTIRVNITKQRTTKLNTKQWNVKLDQRDVKYSNAITTNSSGHPLGIANAENCLDAANANNLARWKFLKNFKNPCWRKVLVLGGRVFSRIFCIPYFFVAGFPKCGTTDLFDRMSLHPDFIPPPFKELHWLTRFRFHSTKKQNGMILNKSTINDLDKGFFIYTSMFKKVSQQRLPKNAYNNKITGDFSPSTLWDSDACALLDINKGHPIPKYINADFVAKMNPCAKIIVLMRNPVQRLYSDYLHFHRNPNVSPEDFHKRVHQTIERYNECLKKYELRQCVHNFTLDQDGIRLRVGMYHVYIEDWYLRFPRSNFLFLRFEDYIANVVPTMEKIFHFLDMEKANSSLLEQISLKQPSNTRKDRTKENDVEPMLEETRVCLEQFYLPFNIKLAELLGDKRYLW